MYNIGDKVLFIVEGIIAEKDEALQIPSYYMRPNGEKVHTNEESRYCVKFLNFQNKLGSEWFWETELESLLYGRE